MTVKSMPHPSKIYAFLTLSFHSYDSAASILKWYFSKSFN